MPLFDPVDAVVEDGYLSKAPSVAVLLQDPGRDVETAIIPCWAGESSRKTRSRGGLRNRKKKCRLVLHGESLIRGPFHKCMALKTCKTKGQDSVNRTATPGRPKDGARRQERGARANNKQKKVICTAQVKRARAYCGENVRPRAHDACQGQNSIKPYCCPTGEKEKNGAQSKDDVFLSEITLHRDPRLFCHIE